MASAREAATLATERVEMAQKELCGVSEALLSCIPPDSTASISAGELAPNGAQRTDSDVPQQQSVSPFERDDDDDDHPIPGGSPGSSYTYQLPLSLIPEDTP